MASGDRSLQRVRAVRAAELTCPLERREPTTDEDPIPAHPVLFEEQDGLARYQGITFYAKGNGTVTLSVATSSVVPVRSGGTCTASCFDYHATKVVLGGAWTLQRIPWSDLRQGGWGAPAVFSATRIMFIEFEFGVGVTFDLYVDQLGFY